MDCIVCGEVFEAKRKDAKYCSARCRVRAGRVTDNPVTDNPPSHVTDNIPGYGTDLCECKHCQQARGNKSRNVINHAQPIPFHALGRQEVNRVSLPGDFDYKGFFRKGGGGGGIRRGQGR